MLRSIHIVCFLVIAFISSEALTINPASDSQSLLDNLKGGHFSPEVLFEWDNVTFNFTGSPWGNTAGEAVAAGAYKIENNVITGVNYYKLNSGEELFFVCVPRWRDGVPSTLNVVEAATGKLRPWPSWEFNTKTVRYVQSVWVDQPSGKIYIIDAGRENFLGNVSSNIINGSASLHVLDIETKQRVYHHVFKDDIFFPNSSFLNDIVLDAKRQVVYMSDTNTAGLGAIVAHDLNSGFSQRYQGPSTLAQPSYHIEILGIHYPFNSPADGITLSDDGKKVYYSVIEGATLFSLDAHLLSSPNATQRQIENTVQNISYKASFSDGLRTLPLRPTSDGAQRCIVLYGAIGECSLHAAVLQRVGTIDVVYSDETLVTNTTTLQWLDTFAYIPKAASKYSGTVLFTT